MGIINRYIAFLYSYMYLLYGTSLHKVTMCLNGQDSVPFVNLTTAVCGTKCFGFLCSGSSHGLILNSYPACGDFCHLLIIFAQFGPKSGPIKCWA